MEEKQEARVDNLIAEVMAAHHIPGLAVAVLQAGKPLLTKGYGWANLEHRAPVTADSVFAIASVTKLFTAAAVMTLVEAGKVQLQDRLAAHLPELPPAWHRITVQNALSHQSGIRNYTHVPDYWDTTRLDVPRQQILDLVRNLPLDFAPGERYAYDNTGYYLLGILIERVSGRSYGAYLAETIFRPLGMAATRVNDPYAVVSHRVAGYSRPGDVWRNAEYYSPSGTYAAGVLLSSATDLSRWAGAPYTEQILTATSWQQMLTPHPSAAKNERREHFYQGLGWFLVDYRGRHFAGHNGNMIGFASSFCRFRPEEVTVIVLYNVDTVTEPHAIAYDVASLFW